jgi:hypothetical protein
MTESEPPEESFLTTLGREFAAEVGELAEEVCGQDAYEVFSAVFGQEVTRAKLRAATASDLERLAEAANGVFEISEIDSARMARVIAAVLGHWREG